MIEVISTSYLKAFYEINEIIKHMKKDLQEKIPEELKNNIEKARDKRHVFSYNEYLPLSGQKLLPETKELLAVIYTKYICSKEEREKWEEYNEFYLEQLSKKEQESKANTYNEIDEENNIDKKDEVKKEKTILEKNELKENTLLAKVEKESVFDKLKKYIKNIFNK